MKFVAGHNHRLSYSQNESGHLSKSCCAIDRATVIQITEPDLRYPQLALLGTVLDQDLLTGSGDHIKTE